MNADRPHPPFSDDDVAWMDLALTEAARGVGLTSPNPPVGAVLVKDGKLIGKGWHRRAGEAHAEIAALVDARQCHLPDAIIGATLYVTLEPCSTIGRTGACTDAITAAGIARVVVGAVDPNPAHAGAGLDQLRLKGIEVDSGCREAEASRLIRFFAKHMTTGRPFVIAKSAITLDGRTVLREGDGPWISSEASREDVQRLRRSVDAILVGGETVRRDNPRLTLRGDFAHDRPQPWRVVLSSRDLPAECHLLSDDHQDRTLVFHDRTLDDALADLGARGVQSVLIESGGRLFQHALSAGLIDEVVLYIAPLLGGGTRHLFPADNLVADLVDVEWLAIGPDLRLTGRPKLRL